VRSAKRGQTAADVKYSFDTLTEKSAAPRFRLYFGDIERVVLGGQMTLRFEFKRASHEQTFAAGTLPVFFPRWGQAKPFADVQTDAPIASVCGRAGRLCARSHPGGGPRRAIGVACTPADALPAAS
jgi:hypothetical protein